MKSGVQCTPNTAINEYNITTLMIKNHTPHTNGSILIAFTWMFIQENDSIYKMYIIPKTVINMFQHSWITSGTTSIKKIGYESISTF